MNQEIKKQWVEALRSGEYVQGEGRLRCQCVGEIRHCCLGVLGEIYVKAHPDNEWIRDPYGVYSLDSRKSVLPDAVVKWAGLSDANPDVKTLDGLDSWLSQLNDNGTSFTEIASIIEAQL